MAALLVDGVHRILFSICSAQSSTFLPALPLRLIDASICCSNPSSCFCSRRPPPRFWHVQHIAPPFLHPLHTTDSYCSRCGRTDYASCPALTHRLLGSLECKLTHAPACSLRSLRRITRASTSRCVSPTATTKGHCFVVISMSQKNS